MEKKTRARLLLPTCCQKYSCEAPHLKRHFILFSPFFFVVADKASPSSNALEVGYLFMRTGKRNSPVARVNETIFKSAMAKKLSASQRHSSRCSLFMHFELRRTFIVATRGRLNDFIHF